eukprot:scaffold547_cov14-Tisochrysis_lutea.AAC.1
MALNLSKNGTGGRGQHSSSSTLRSCFLYFEAKTHQSTKGASGACHAMQSTTVQQPCPVCAVGDTHCVLALLGKFTCSGLTCKREAAGLEVAQRRMGTPVELLLFWLAV